MNKLFKNQWLIATVTITILVVMVAWLAGAFSTKVAPATITQKSAMQMKNTFQLAALVEQNYEPVAASIVAKQASIISSRILARIEKINVRAGDYVKKGQVLIQLEISDLQAQVQQAKEQIKAVNARYIEAEKNLKRSDELLKQKLISSAQFDKNNADFLAIAAELNSAEQSLKRQESILTYATLTAPIDGRIVDRFAEPGNTAQPGAKLLSIYNPNSLRVEANVREQLAIHLAQGQTLAVELPATKFVMAAQIAEIVPAANIGSHSFLIKATIDSSEQLLPGMYARILVPAGQQTTLYIPKHFVSQVGQLDYVWVQVAEQSINTWQKRFVRLGKENNQGMVAVVSGLMAGDVIGDN